LPGDLSHLDKAHRGIYLATHAKGGSARAIGRPAYMDLPAVAGYMNFLVGDQPWMAGAEKRHKNLKT